MIARSFLWSVVIAITLSFTYGIALAQEPAPAAEPAPAPKFRGFVIEHAESGSKLRLAGLIQADGVFFPDDEEEAYDDEFVLRRVRTQFQGTVFKIFDARIHIEVVASRLNLLDAYVGLKLFDELQLRVGKMKAPVGLERLQGAGDIVLYERAFPTLLAPNRDIGAMVFGDAFGGILHYSLGVFDGTPDGGSVEENFGDGFDVAGRLFVRPLKGLDNPWLQELGLGVAGTWGEATGSASATDLASARTSGRATFFRYVASDDATAIADGTRWRVMPQLSYYGGPIGITGEYIYSTQEITLGDTHETVANQAWQATLQFVATLDKVTARGVEVERPFDLTTGGLGAVELLGRFHQFIADDTAFDAGFASRNNAASKATAWSAGVAWHFNTAVKLLAAFERTSFEGGAADGADRPTENMVQTRLQLRF